jgi:hypothetical protein
VEAASKLRAMTSRADTLRWITLAAAIEAAATGLLLIISPTTFSWLILGSELSDPGQPLGRLAGIALFGTALPAWPAPVAASPRHRSYAPS